MENLHYIMVGFQVCLQPANLLLAFVGCLIGTLIGVLPGLGPAAAIALLLPTSFSLTPVGAIIMLSGIYYGSMYGGSTTSILLNIPGEAASVVTCMDGYAMAKQGRAGSALGIAAFGSFIAGTIAIVLLTFLAPPLASVALKFGPPEYTTLVVLGLTLLAFMAKDSLKAIIMGCMGIFLSTVGIDAISGTARFCFDKAELMDGIGLVPVIMGLFGVSEVFINIESTMRREILDGKIASYLPTKEDWKKAYKPILRGSILGFLVGILPGGGAVLSSFLAYAVEKRLSKHPERFGTGMIEGVAAPEAANNSACGAHFIPLMSLGIPCTAVMAILMGAMMIHGLSPGPNLIHEHPDFFWGVIVSMYIGNIMLLVLNLPLIGLWVQVLKVPYRLLFPFIILFCLIGAYTLNNSSFDVLVMSIFGIIGYLMKKVDFEGAPLILGMVLGGTLENSLRQSLILSNGNFSIFMNRPIACSFLVIALILLVISSLPSFRKRIPLPTEETVD